MTTLALLRKAAGRLFLSVSLGTRLHVRMRTTIAENGVLRNGQQLGRAENSFIDQGEIIATLTVKLRAVISISFVVK